jgi:imidazolonepropionase
MMEDYAPARKLIDEGVPIALATDLNPNCWVENMQFIVQLGCFKMKMKPAEAIVASTFNSACSIGVNDRVGSIEIGKDADIILLDCPNHLFLTYNIGVNLVETVIKSGVIII